MHLGIDLILNYAFCTFQDSRFNLKMFQHLSIKSSIFSKFNDFATFKLSLILAKSYTNVKDKY